jgi:hypothetical protein
LLFLNLIFNSIVFFKERLCFLFSLLMYPISPSTPPQDFHLKKLKDKPDEELSHHFSFRDNINDYQKVQGQGSNRNEHSLPGRNSCFLFHLRFCHFQLRRFWSEQGLDKVGRGRGSAKSTNPHGFAQVYLQLWRSLLHFLAHTFFKGQGTVLLDDLRCQLE